MSTLKLLALSGSLRTGSYNTAAIKALRDLAPADIDITIGSIGELPLFNVDHENDDIAALALLKSALSVSSGLIISSPEYAHGISGPLKNTLDWLVSGEEFPSMPVMLINTSPRAFHAQEALKEVLTTMSANIIEAASVSIPLLGSELDDRGILANLELVAVLKSGLDMFCQAIRER